MAIGIHSIQVRRERGKLTVVAIGKTPRGQSYIKHSLGMHASSMRDKEFKDEMSAIVEAFFLPADTEG